MGCVMKMGEVLWSHTFKGRQMPGVWVQGGPSGISSGTQECLKALHAVAVKFWREAAGCVAFFVPL